MADDNKKKDDADAKKADDEKMKGNHAMRTVRIEMGKTKAASRIFVDDCEVTRGLLDFEVHSSYQGSGVPAVSLTLWPEKLEVCGELSEVIKRDLISMARDRDVQRLFEAGCWYENRRKKEK